MTEIVQQIPAQQSPVTKFNENTVEMVLNRVGGFQKNGDLKLPPNYSAENSVRSAWLILQETVDMNKNPVLSSCTKESIANALLDMVIQGLSPVKKQCYFIAYGGKLQLQKSYMGTVAIAKRVGDVQDAIANVVYMGDEFDYEIDTKTGRKTIIKHVQKLENIDPGKIKGFYATVIKKDGTYFTEIMTIAQVRNSWAMGKAKGDSPAHRQFPDQMGMKTVISRALKIIIGSSDDSSLYEEEDTMMAVDTVSENVKGMIEEKANKSEMNFQQQEEILQQETIPEESTSQQDNSEKKGPGF